MDLFKEVWKSMNYSRLMIFCSVSHRLVKNLLVMTHETYLYVTATNNNINNYYFICTFIFNYFFNYIISNSV